MSGYQTLRLHREGAVTVLEMNRPEVLNALDATAQAELITALAQIAADKSSRAVLFTGAARAFSAGGDIGSMPGAQGDPAARFAIAQETTRSAKTVLQSFLTLPQPLVAAVNGDAIGLGATLALCADVVVMAETARIGDPHVRLGMVAGDGGAVLWPALIGPARAKEFLLRGNLLKAADAQGLGLVGHIRAPDEMQGHAMALATELAALPALAAVWTKQVVNKPLLAQLELVFDAGIAFEALSFLSADHREAVLALQEKRPPVFSGM